MQVKRMDLDGPGAGSPAGLVMMILKAEPKLTIPVPIEELAHQLDISDIHEMSSDGFEGGLVTNEARTHGLILVNSQAHRVRKRFTIAHELCHFLIPRHKSPGGRFQCSREDMRQWLSKDQEAVRKMEAEANEFASLILMPPRRLQIELAKFEDPDISQILSLAQLFDVSREATARAYARYNDHAISIVVVSEGKVERTYRGTRFPFSHVKSGDPVPKSSAFHRAKDTPRQPSQVEQAQAADWLEAEWGNALPPLYEQVLFQQSGYAMIMLWAEMTADDEEDPDEGKTSKQRFQDQQARWESRR